MIRGGRGGSIVNVASIEASRAAPTYAMYGAAKAGMVGDPCGPGVIASA
jgi:NAD(P)-dependent dehydrogenase (short-subunit alcohol dehydrogenase family)